MDYCIVIIDGDMWYWNCNNEEPYKIDLSEKVRSVAMSYWECLVLTQNNQIYTTNSLCPYRGVSFFAPKNGVNDSKEKLSAKNFKLMMTQGTENIKQISCGDVTSLILDNEGIVYGIGDLTYYRHHYDEEDKQDGEYDYNSETPTKLDFKICVRKMSTNEAHSIFLTPHGEIYGCGTMSMDFFRIFDDEKICKIHVDYEVEEMISCEYHQVYVDIDRKSHSNRSDKILEDIRLAIFCEDIPIFLTYEGTVYSGDEELEMSFKVVDLQSTMSSQIPGLLLLDNDNNIYYIGDITRRSEPLKVNFPKGEVIFANSYCCNRSKITKKSE